MNATIGLHRRGMTSSVFTIVEAGQRAAMSRAAHAWLGLLGGLPLMALAASALPLSGYYPLYLLLIGLASGWTGAAAWHLTGRLRQRRRVMRPSSDGPSWGGAIASRLPVTFLVAVLVATTTTGSVAPAQAEPQVDAAASSRSQFVLVEQGAVPAFNRAALTAELERVWARTAPEWGVLDAAPVEVYIYADREDYARLSPGGKGSAGSMQCLEEGPRLYLYLERSANGVAAVSLSTARHEAAHAVMCQALGVHAFQLIPHWVHEGYARSVQYQGWEHFWVRGTNRTWVWEARGRLMDAESFCAFDTRQPGNEDVSLFYATAWELLRHLETAHGTSIVSDLSTLVRDDTDSESAMRAVLGTSCPAVYKEWTASFL